MTIQFTTRNPDKSALDDYQTECLIILLDQVSSAQWSSTFSSAAGELIQQVVNDGDLQAKAGQCLLLPRPSGFKSERVLLVHTGRKDTLLEPVNWQKLATKVAETLVPLRAKDAIIVSTSIALTCESIRALADSIMHKSYQFTRFKTEPSKPFSLTHVSFLIPGEPQIDEQLRIARASHIGQCISRDLANTPPNICTPEYCWEQALTLAKTYPALQCEKVTEEDMQALGMGAYLAVSQGSHNAAVMTVMHYQGTTPQAKPFVFVGKGVTFDTGGITLKGSDGMQNMIYDMCGATTVMGLMAAIAELALPINVIGIVAAVENMPDGKAYRPSDVLTTMSGQTVEVISTDAEGRLVLCDCLTYVERYSPAAVIDIATLTGAAIVALGHHASGLMSNNASLADALTTAGQQAHDPAWQMPIWSEYEEALESTSADMVNSGKGSPGMITAGCFLSRFAGSFPWAHLDIAGTAFHYGKGNSATGRPLPLLLQYLLNSC